MLDLNLVKKAASRIEGIAVQTPFTYAPLLSEVSEAKVFVKKENLQLTGAFKLRGAFNKVASLSQEKRKKGIIAASAGNHAQGVAYAAKHFGIKSVIIMPETTPLTKINGVSSYGAEVVLAGSNYDEAYAYAIDYSKKNDLEFVHPFEDEEVIAGQGTVALEMLNEQADLDVIVVPMGGGGLISGVAIAAKAINPNIKIIGVSAKGAPALKTSFEKKTAVHSSFVRTIADGIAVRDTSEITLAYMLKYVDEVVGVDDEEIANAILFLLEKQKLVVEGAGSVAFAALLHHKIQGLKDKKVGVILSGGNIDVTMLSVIIEKGLLKSGRKMKLTVTLVDKPGSLMKLTELLQGLYANIVHISYDRTSTSLDYGDAHVTIDLETKGEAHQQEIRSVLLEHAYLRDETK
ncbi:threonine ammonia-lyase [Sulfurimonas sp. MAG313]|nr:threonine ammonia-lyase [Sulfurimonas sp. MAG313]MDF1880674.1 threonine ammonia-lyase [Sulfurimonas sp. MAG313]